VHRVLQIADVCPDVGNQLQVSCNLRNHTFSGALTGGRIRGKAKRGALDDVTILRQPWQDPLIKPRKGICAYQRIRSLLENRPVATGGIRGQCPPNFVAPRKICFKHIVKPKILPPQKCIVPQQILKPGYGSAWEYGMTDIIENAKGYSWCTTVKTLTVGKTILATQEGYAIASDWLPTSLVLRPIFYVI